MIKIFIYKIVFLAIIIIVNYKNKNNIEKEENRKVLKINIKRKDSFKKNYKTLCKKININERIKKNERIFKKGSFLIFKGKIFFLDNKKKEIKIKNLNDIEKIKKKNKKLKKFIKSKKIFKICLYKDNNIKKNIKKLEGYFFSEKIFLNKKKKTKKNLKLLINKQFSLFKKNKIIKKIIHSNLNSHEILTLASIVEKESSYNFEKKKISKIFKKRLKEDINLQSCATVKYGLDIKKVYLKHLKIINPYNTYIMKGIPPSPIGNIKKKTIKKIIKERKTSKMFFKKKKKQKNT